MHRPRRGRLPHDVPSWVPEGAFFFITINCATAGYNQLCCPGLGHAVLAAAAHNHDTFTWHCRIMLLMPDHLHAIISFPRTPVMKRVVENWKHYLASHKKIDWQRDFFDHRLRNHHEEQEKLSYILMNPVRLGLCERAEDWPWIYRPGDRPSPRPGY